MIASDLKDLWIPGALVLGFQTTSFKWRIEREVELGDRGSKTWLPPCEWVGLAGMLIVLAGVFLLPLGNQISLSSARVAMVIGTFCLVGQVLGLCGHYRLFTGRARTDDWCTREELVTLAVVALLGFAYLGTAKPDATPAEPASARPPSYS